MPFGRVKVDYQSFEREISLKKNELVVKGLGSIRIEQNFLLSVFDNYLGKLFFNGAEIAKVEVKNSMSMLPLVFEVNFSTDQEEVKFYSLILLAIENVDIDGD